MRKIKYTYEILFTPIENAIVFIGRENSTYLVWFDFFEFFQIVDLSIYPHRTSIKIIYNGLKSFSGNDYSNNDEFKSEY